MAKVDSSSESNKVEMDRLKERCATLEANLVSLTDNNKKAISDAILAQSDEQDLRIWKLIAGTTMQLSLESCERNLLIIGLKPTWDPKATFFDIFKDFARTNLKLNESNLNKNWPRN